MPAKKKTAKRSPKQLSPSAEERRQESAIHDLMPWILAGVAVFLCLCYLLGEGETGFLGKYLKSFFTGIFSVGAYALPVLLLIHAVFYRRDLKAGSHLYKFWFSLGDVIFLGVICALTRGAEVTFSLSENYTAGQALAGGGLFGGFFYAVLEKSIGNIGTWIFSVAAVVVLTSFLFGKTPTELIRTLFAPVKRQIAADAKVRRENAPDEEEKAALRAEKEAQKQALAEQRALEKYRLREEKREERKRKKCEANLESGEPVTEEMREDKVGELEISLSEKEEAARPKEIMTIEEIESEPVPSLHEEIREIFSNPPAEEIAPPAEELASEFTQAEEEIKTALAGKYKEPAPAKEPEPVKEPVEIGAVQKPEPEYHFPPLSLLAMPKERSAGDLAEQETTARKLVETLESFGVKTSVIGISKGPTVTRYELQPQRGVRVRSIVNLTDDIALSLAAGGVRIEAPIPGKEAVGIEVPNRTKETVYVRSLIDSAPFREAKSRLNCSLGHDVAGKPVFCDLAKMPHILIAGATGMGKSVCLNSFIVSILYHARPEEVQMILIDPKKVEMGKYNGIPHLLVPVVSDPKKAAGALNWAVIEMEKRFIEMEEVGVRDIQSYNEITKNDPDRRFMSHIVIIIDELADLMMTARDEVETSICRIAQKARAAGMHLVIGTQRPSVDVITGLIKANVPSRIACTVASQVDSRTILDVVGAEKLLGRGDMLYAPVGSMKPMRVQGSFVSDEEVEAVCDFLRSQRGAQYDDSVVNLIEREAAKCGEKKKGASFFSSSEEAGSGGGLFADKDELLERAVDIAVAEKKISTSLLQRKLSVGYARAAKLIDYMAEMNIVGPYGGSKGREVLWSEQYYAEYKMRALEKDED